MSYRLKKNQVKFYLKNKKNGQGTIFAIFFCGYKEDGKYVPFQMSTGEHIEVCYWDEINQCAIKNPNVEWQEINMTLKRVEIQITDAYKELLSKNADVNPETLRKAIEKTTQPNINRPQEKITLIGFTKKYLNTCGKDWRTARHYRTTLNYLEKFSKSRRRSYEFDEIDMTFYRDFVKYLKSLNLRMNTIGGHLKNLKVFLRVSYHQKIHTNGAFMDRDFKVLQEEVDSIYLDHQELTRIKNLDLSKYPIIEETRDVFLIAALTGLRYSDIENLKTENIGSDGIIRISAIKTQKQVVLPIGSTVAGILDKYSPRLPRVVCNQQFNNKLKVIAKLAKLNNWESITRSNGGIHTTKKFLKYWLVSSHTARRSFATNMALSGVPTSQIMAVTGHKTERSFWKYVKIRPVQNAAMLKNHPYLNI